MCFIIIKYITIVKIFIIVTITSNIQGKSYNSIDNTIIDELHFIIKKTLVLILLIY